MTQSNFISPKVGIMIDIETLDLGPRPVITQVAMYSWGFLNPETIVRSAWHYLPIQPQLELLRPRTFSAGTLGWWMQQGDDARLKLAESIEGDYDDLAALVRATAREFKFMIEGLGKGEYEVWARGPQFDIVAIETLFIDLGVEIPWKYDTLRDLRTAMALAGITGDGVEKPEGFIPHQAGWDCLYQIKCLTEAVRKMGAR